MNLLDEKRIKIGYQSSREIMADIYILIYGMLALCLEEDAKETNTQYIKMKKYVESRFQKTSQKVNVPLIELIVNADLSEWQVFQMLLGSFSIYSPQSAAIFNEIPENGGKPYPTKGLAIYLYQKYGNLSEEEYEEYVDEGVFFQLFFIKLAAKQEGLAGFGTMFSLREEVFSYLFGGWSLSLKCRNYCEYSYSKTEIKDILIYQKEAKILENILMETLLKKKEKTAICLKGEMGAGKKFLFAYLASLVGKGILYVDYTCLEQEDDINETLHILTIECMLKEAIFCLINFSAKEEKSKQIIKNISQFNTIFFVSSEESVLKKISESVKGAEVSLNPPEVEEKILLWNYFLKNYKTSNEIKSEYLASRYVLNAGSIFQILESASLYADIEQDGIIGMAEIKKALKQYQASRLSGFAESIPVCFDWNDLVIETETEKLLRHICSRINQKNQVENIWGFGKKIPYGKGVCALFYGPPGTGKTMAVQVLAGEMGLELYRIDLSRMISKYIGETQKHITELFEKAKEMNALLFFDEADAFFSKRTEVSDALDRHANGDVAHLLQKLEEYDGISILATNLKDNIDNAFKRRIQYMVHFQQPDAKIREILWKKQFPAEVPVEEELELEFFAKHFELSGSEIKNVILTAAFMAAEQGKPISNSHIIEALKLNYAKYGRVLTKADFGDMGW